ncbi:hypothetical protein ACO22_07871 [Paracoccidioides brasiliensis]|uniref:Mitochondrial adapter protein MCP1 transmembrane domain-containing protein n=1 Tax=Paracoccidioides brasiliensis TaxID=121759 RepID=A0A1D2J3G5_PARBR|nr:hypothetical protein ACO22_07871 [Paracoccidioides brasiliensis]
MDEKPHSSGQRRSAEINQASPILLQELEPSPIEWSPDLELGEYFPNTRSGSEGRCNCRYNPFRYLNLGLGLSGRGWENWLSILQRTSTYPPTIFLGLHLSNTSIIPLLTGSVPSAEPFLLLTRPLYQSPALEPLLLTIPVLTHLASGVALRILRARRRTRLYGAETHEQRNEIRSSGNWKYPSIQARLGYMLLPLLASHVLVNRVVPLYVDGGSSGVGLGFVAHGIARSPWLMNLGYAAFVGVGVWHFAWGWAWWMGYKREVAETGKGKGKRVGRSTGPNGGFLGSFETGGEFRRRSRKKPSKVLSAFSSQKHTFDLRNDLIGGCSIDTHGTPITKTVMQAALDSDAVLFASVGGPKWDGVRHGLEEQGYGKIIPVFLIF